MAELAEEEKAGAKGAEEIEDSAAALRAEGQVGPMGRRKRGKTTGPPPSTRIARWVSWRSQGRLLPSSLAKNLCFCPPAPLVPAMSVWPSVPSVPATLAQDSV